MAKVWTAFKRAVKSRFPGCVVSKVPWTQHHNVISVVMADGTRCVSKFILEHDYDDMRAAHVAHAIEKRVYRDLPAFFGVRLVDGMHVPGLGYVITTTEMASRPWSTYVSNDKDDRSVVRQLKRQLRWLHANGIAHGDLELKNVLLGKESPIRVSIIDFEKSTLRASEKKMKVDVETLWDRLRAIGIEPRSKKI
jgi:tRNA A-37 threonylcarbamoyl transferase component Bud32